MTNDPEIRASAWLSKPPGALVAGAVLLVALAGVLFTNLGVDPVGSASEALASRVVSGMVASGDWLVPQRGQMLRLQRPPLLSWAGTTTAKLLGDAGPIAVRLPSALACLGLVALVMRWARSLGGAGQGLAAGAVLVAAIQLTTSGRRGDAEMLLALLCVASYLVFDRLHTTQRRALLPVFGVLGGLAILTQGLAVGIVIALPILVFLALQRELPRLRDPGVLGACALALAIGGSWFGVLIALTPDAFGSVWFDLVLPLGRTAAVHGDGANVRPIWWYLGALPARAAPASLLLPVVVWRLYTTRVYRGDPRKRFAALTFLVPLVAFSLLPQKHGHYTLPMLPGLAIVTAEGLAALATGARAWLTTGARAWLARGLGALLALAGIAATVLLALFLAWVEGLPPVGVAIAATAVGALFALAFATALRGWPVAFAAAWVPAFLLALAVHRGVVDVRVARIREGGYQGMMIDERERVFRTARAHPWFVDVLNLATGIGDD